MKSINEVNATEGADIKERKRHIFPFTIAYADTDAGGIVYHARYIEIAERARMNWLKCFVPPDGDLGIVVKEITVKYLHALKVGEEIRVESIVTNIGGASISLEQKIMKDGVVHAILTGTAVYLGANKRPKRIPETILSIIADYI